MSKISTKILIAALSVMLVFPQFQVSAVSMTMDEVKALYREKTGNDWSKGTADERREFLYSVIGRKKVETREKRVEGVKVPYYIREGFFKSKGYEWEEGDEKEQKVYIKNYKRMVRDQEKAERQRLKDAAKKKRKIAREERRSRRDYLRRIRDREREKRDEERAEAKKRREEKKRLTDAKKGRTELKKKLKDLQNRSRGN